MVEKAAINSERLLSRFLRYVQVNTTANAQTDEYPSSAGQWQLGEILLAELHEIGADDVHVDSNALVWAMIPGNVPHAETIAWNAHLDTSPETTGEHVQPQVIESYGGGDIVLPGDTSKVITVAESPELEALIGKTLITTDGQRYSVVTTKRASQLLWNPLNIFSTTQKFLTARFVYYLRAMKK